MAEPEELKIRIRADDLIRDANQLVLKLIKKDFFPTYIYNIKRGGDYVGNSITEVYKQIHPHIYGEILVSSYELGTFKKGKPKIWGIAPPLEDLCENDKILIVDDCADTRETIKTVLEEFEKKTSLSLDKHLPFDERKLVYVVRDYKDYPYNDDVKTIPDLWIKKWNMGKKLYWLIYPHEFDGLSEEEILENHGINIRKLKKYKPK